DTLFVQVSDAMDRSLVRLAARPKKQRRRRAGMALRRQDPRSDRCPLQLIGTASTPCRPCLARRILARCAEHWQQKRVWARNYDRSGPTLTITAHEPVDCGTTDGKVQ